MAAPGLSRIHQISMRVHDVDRAVRFYRDALGVPFLFAAPPRLAFFDCGGVRLMLSTPEPGFDHPGSVVYFAVEDIAEAHASLKARGVTFSGEPHKIATLADRDLVSHFGLDAPATRAHRVCKRRQRAFRFT